MSDVDTAFEQQLLHIAIAQGEAIVEPDAMADDLPGKAVVFVALGVSGCVMSAASSEVGVVCEGASLRALCHGLGRMVNNLTMPLLVMAWPPSAPRTDPVGV